MSVDDFGVNDFGMPPDFEAIPMMESQEFQVGDTVEVIETGQQGDIRSISIDPSVEGCLVIHIHGIGGAFTTEDIMQAT